MQIDLFAYLDYRKFLIDWYHEKKSTNGFISYRYIGNKVGLDASFLVKLFQEQVHLSQKSISRFIEFLNLNPKEKEYLEVLISYNRAKNSSEVHIYYQRLISLRMPHIKKIESDQYEFFNHWFYTAIYELIRCHNFKGDFRELGRKLRPPISAIEAKNAVSLLGRLGYVNLGSDGKYQVKDASLSTGDSWMSQAISEYQKKLIGMGIEAIENIPKADRDISTVTVSLSRGTFESIRERIQCMRKELLELSSLEKNPSVVYQMNFQIFPLSMDAAVQGKVS